MRKLHRLALRKRGKIVLSEVSKANISVATNADVIKTDEGFSIKVWNEYGSEIIIDKDKDIVFYSTKGAAKLSVKRHNKSIIWGEGPVKPSPSMLPPEKR